MTFDSYLFAYRNNVNSVLHSFKNYDQIINDAVNGWLLAKEKCLDPHSRNLCDKRIFDNVTKYIKYSCQIGVPVNQIAKAVEKAPIKDTLDNYDVLWNSSKAVYEPFMADPYTYWKKQRGSGIKNEIKRILGKSIIARKVYQRLTYKTDIRAYII